MTFDWKDYYHLAKSLSNDVGDEASIRSAISRYYYSAFCSARYYLVEVKHEEHLLDIRGAHTKVYSFLQKSDDLNENELGEILETLFEKRNCADYDWRNTDLEYFKNDLSIVEALVEKAFLNIDALNNSPSDFKIP